MQDDLIALAQDLGVAENCDVDGGFVAVLPHGDVHAHDVALHVPCCEIREDTHIPLWHDAALRRGRGHDHESRLVDERSTAVGLLDLIPRVIEISVVLGDDDPIGLNVLSTSSKKEVLSVELCDATLALLLKGAKAQVPSKRRIPDRSHVGEGYMHIAEANVHWCAKRGAVYCSFTDVNGTKRMRHMTVKKSDVPERYAEMVAAAAEKCQQHYDDNNVNPPTSDD